MKRVIILGDGMADYPIPALGEKTPLMVANAPTMAFMAQNGEVGLVKTIPDSLAPGSDTANLSVMGYHPELYYTGRSPLEAISMGVPLFDDDVTYRANLVTLAGDGPLASRTMQDYSAGEISSEEARILIEFLAEHLSDENTKLYPGVSYRHCLRTVHGETGSKMTPPHDILGKPVKEYLPSGNQSERFLSLMERSLALLADHPVNLARVARGENPANALWLWGEGKKPLLPDFLEKTGLKGGVISAVDLIKGIGLGAKMRVFEVEGATGNIRTNFAGKGKTACLALKEVDFLYVHVEAPDECGHQGQCAEKIEAIEKIDEFILRPVLEALQASGEDFAIMVLPDHPTPLALRTHVRDAVPFAIYRGTGATKNSALSYNEESAKGKLFFARGCDLFDYFLRGE